MLALLIVVILLSIGIYFGILYWPEREPKPREQSRKGRI